MCRSTIRAVPATPGPSAEREAQDHLRGSTLLLAGRLLSLAVGFVTQVVVVRYLSATGFGAFAYALSWVALGQLLCGLGLQRSLGLFLAGYDRDGDDARILGLLRLLLLTIGVSGALLLLVVLGGQALTGGQLLEDRLASSLLVILILLAPLQAGDDLLSGLLAFLGSTRSIFVRQHVVEPALKLTIVLLLVASGSGVRTLAVGYVVGGVLGLTLYGRALVVALDRRGIRERMRGVRPIVPWRQVLAYTLPLLSTDLVAVCLTNVDAVLLGHYRDATAVGALRVVQPLAALNLVVFSSFTLLYVPAAARLHAAGDLAGLRDLYWRTTTWIALLTFPVLAVTTSLSGPVTELLFGQRYADSGPYLALLALGSYASAAVGFNGLTIRVFGYLRFTLVVNVVAVVANLALGLLLIPRYGALGAAEATALSLLLHNALKQVGLGRSLGGALPPARRRLPFLALLAAGSLLALERLVFGTAVVPALVAVVVSVAGVLLVGLRTMDVGGTFPMLARRP